MMHPLTQVVRVLREPVVSPTSRVQRESSPRRQGRQPVCRQGTAIGSEFIVFPLISTVNSHRQPEELRKDSLALARKHRCQQ